MPDGVKLQQPIACKPRIRQGKHSIINSNHSNDKLKHETQQTQTEKQTQLSPTLNSSIILDLKKMQWNLYCRATTPKIGCIIYDPIYIKLVLIALGLCGETHAY